MKKSMAKKIEDAGLDDDEGGDEAETGQESEAVEAEEGLAPEPQSRGEKRFQKLSETARQEAARRQALEVEVAALRAEREARERAAAAPKQESEADEAARLSLMTVEERVDYRLAKAEKRHQFEMNVTRFQSADFADKSAYENKGGSEPEVQEVSGGS